ncbi:GNAT family N-acetyltransferase [Oricola indica]|jgi:RimJ/RimL family protein N-acetyltransferase|uniref:GNAT family N-acetyltransferase n=1 Tax=Oricola indica TaxID=2872591 RepID=UPI001CBC3E0D|nr:GNAT family N-acetyltransferase [Oricola indica]
MVRAADIPVIETERLKLRAFRLEDFAAVAAYKADPLVMRFVGGPEGKYKAWKSFTAMAGTWSILGFGYFCVAEKDTDRCIGHCSLLEPPDWPGREIGYTLSRGAHGRGYASEAAAAVLRFAYETLDWPTAISVIDPDNAASQGVARRLGAARERERVPVQDFTADIWPTCRPKHF